MEIWGPYIDGAVLKLDSLEPILDMAANIEGLILISLFNYRQAKVCYSFFLILIISKQLSHMLAQYT